MIECDSRLLQFSSILMNNPDINKEIPCKLHDSALLNKIIEFYELFNFDKQEFETAEFNKKINSDQLSYNLTLKCLDYLKP